ncbi:MAG: type II toxin-antitoxin system VapB family antitoxin [Salinarimonas sp.]
MSTTVPADAALLARAKQLTGIETDAEVVQKALKALIAQESARRLALLGGTEPDLEVPPRRREPA